MNHSTRFIHVHIFPCSSFCVLSFSLYTMFSFCQAFMLFPVSSFEKISFMLVCVWVGWQTHNLHIGCWMIVSETVHFFLLIQFDFRCRSPHCAALTYFPVLISLSLSHSAPPPLSFSFLEIWYLFEMAFQDFYDYTSHKIQNRKRQSEACHFTWCSIFRWACLHQCQWVPIKKRKKPTYKTLCLRWKVRSWMIDSSRTAFMRLQRLVDNTLAWCFLHILQQTPFPSNKHISHQWHGNGHHKNIQLHQENERWVREKKNQSWKYFN